jgi:hypothetical protein
MKLFLSILRTAMQVWHAGDFGNDVAEKLKDYKPLKGGIW